MSKTKGSNHERQLLSKFNNVKNWTAVRMPGSGSAPMPLPDIVVCSKKPQYTINKKEGLLTCTSFHDPLPNYYAIEVKVTSSHSKNISKCQGEELQDFADKFCASPLFAIKFLKHKRGTWYFIEPRLCRRTKGGNYVIDLDIASTFGVTFNNFIDYHKEEK